MQIKLWWPPHWSICDPGGEVTLTPGSRDGKVRAKRRICCRNCCHNLSVRFHPSAQNADLPTVGTVLTTAHDVAALSSSKELKSQSICVGPQMAPLSTGNFGHVGDSLLFCRDPGSQSAEVFSLGHSSSVEEKLTYVPICLSCLAADYSEYSSRVGSRLFPETNYYLFPLCPAPPWPSPFQASPVWYLHPRGPHSAIRERFSGNGFTSHPRVTPVAFFLSLCSSVSSFTAF